MKTSSKNREREFVDIIDDIMNKQPIKFDDHRFHSKILAEIQ
jgi:hypothetical protein